jgi:hypothetical protein
MPCVWRRSGLKVDSTVDLTRVKCVVACALYSLKSAGALCISEARFFMLIIFLQSIEFSLFLF